MKNIVYALCILCISTATAVAQGITTASIVGRVSDKEGLPANARQIVATHQPSGTKYTTTTTNSGQYTLSGLRVGGPYVVEALAASEQGAKTVAVLELGETRRVDIFMEEKTMSIAPVEIVTEKIAANMQNLQSGANSEVEVQQIANIPTTERNFRDYVRFIPQINIIGDGISVAGTNNRYNTIYIDGAVNNDVFGLATSGTNGGQTGISPISPDAIEQIAVNISPYDVRQGGFAGGSINAVTRSGSNHVQGSAYYLFRNQALAGVSPDASSSKLAPFMARTAGFRVGAPLIKDKLFLFVNAEVQRDETPKPFDASSYLGKSNAAMLDSFSHALKSLGYDPQGYTANTNSLNGEKIFARIDYNLNKYHKLTLRHSYAHGEGTVPITSSTTTINYLSNGSLFKSTTNSSSAELNTTIGRINNSLLLGFTRVNDDRDPLSAFPTLLIRDGRGIINAGSNASSIANYVQQSVLTLTDNFKFVKGDHTITAGMHHELFNIGNLFVSNNYGLYTYDSLAQFLRGIPATSYRRSYAVSGDGTGDNSGGAATFGALQMAFYAQEEWQATKQLRISAGLRADIPMLLDQPLRDGYFADSTMAKLQAKGYDVSQLQAGNAFSPKTMLSPRVGFNYALTPDRKAVLRGGLGIFTSRLPFVWAGAAFLNNGVSIADIGKSNVAFVADVNKQYTATSLGGAAEPRQLDIVRKDFRYPQVFRTSLALDYNLPAGIVATVEGIFSKVLNNQYVYNYNLNPATTPLNSINGVPQTGDNRPYYTNSAPIDGHYSRILVVGNTNKGYSYNLTAQLRKDFNNGVGAMLAYAYSDGRAVSDALAAQNVTQWRFNDQVSGRNTPALMPAFFAGKHRFVGYLTYQKNFLKDAPTTISLVFNAQSGRPYGYIVSGNLNGEDNADANLMYVPRNQSEIVFGANGKALGQTGQDSLWQQLNAFIENDAYLKTRRGQYAERYGARLPFQTTLDVRLAQDFVIKQGNVKHRFQVSADILNFTNMLHQAWGHQYFVTDSHFALLRFEGLRDRANNDYTPLYSFTKPTGNVYSTDAFLSRWRMQIGVRYLFN